MATYKITAPDGNSYNVNAPDDATEADVMAYAQKNYKMASAPKAEKSTMAKIGQGVGNVAAGALRGAGSIGATILSPIDKGMDLYAGDGRSRNTERRQGMDAGLQEMGADTDSFGYGAGKLVGEIAGTAGAGGAIANAARFAAPTLAASRYVAPVVDAIATSGMKAGGMTGAKSLIPRMAGGAVTGAASAGAIDPSQATTGAAIGGALPFGFDAAKYAGKFAGSSLAPFVSQDRVVGNALLKFMDNPSSAIQNIKKSKEIIKGSAPTTAASSGDTGLSALARSLQNSSPEFSNGLAARQTAQNQARTAAFDEIAGNTGKISVAKEMRDNLTNSMRESVLERAGTLDANGVLGSIGKLLKNPENAGKISQKALSEYGNSIAAASDNGMVSARALYAIRKDINDTLSGKLQGEAGNLRFASSQLRKVKDLIDDAIDSASNRTSTSNSRDLIVGNSSNIGLYGGGAEKLPTWKEYLQTYAEKSKPINQMELLQDVLKRVQNSGTDKQGEALLSAAKLANILKNEGADLSKKLSPDQFDLLRRLHGDINGEILGIGSGKSIGSNTMQNLGTSQFMESALGQGLGATTGMTSTLGRLLKLPYGSANEQILSKVSNAMLDPYYAIKAIELAQKRNQLGQSFGLFGAPIAKTAPVIFSDR